MLQTTQFIVVMASLTITVIYITKEKRSTLDTIAMVLWLLVGVLHVLLLIFGSFYIFKEV